jgi:hypothetical protein
MPYASEKQRRYLHANEPALAARWDRKYGSRTLDDLAGKKRKKKPRRRGVSR